MGPNWGKIKGQEWAKYAKNKGPRWVAVFINIAANHLAYPYIASDKFSCTGPDRDAEYFSQLTEAATLWNETKMNFITGFSDERNNFHHRLEVEHCWLDDMNGIPNAQQKTKRATQKKTTKAKVHGIQFART